MKKYRPIKECFELNEDIRANHLLFEDFQAERTDIKKLIFYIFLQENELGAVKGIDPSTGDIGYGLKYVPKEVQNIQDNEN